MLNLLRREAQLAVTLLGLFLSSYAFAQQPYYGHFVGDLILSPVSGGSRMRLLAPYTFIDSSGGTWYAPAGTVTDGASIPPAAKSLIGGSWDGPYRNAAVIHDVACVQRNRPWELVHLTFYHAMLASKVSPRMAKIMYAAVYHLGPRWEPSGSMDLPSKRESSVSSGNNRIHENAGRGCPSAQYEQCWRVDLGPLGEAKDCKCLPKTGGDVGATVESHPKAEVRSESIAREKEIVSRLTSYIDAKERAGGISIEEIQKLNFTKSP